MHQKKPPSMDQILEGFYYAIVDGLPLLILLGLPIEHFSKLNNNLEMAY